MVSAESIDYGKRFYRLADRISVRKERFGLLFYSPIGPRLTFVHSGTWIQPELFEGNISLKKWLADQGSFLSGQTLGEMGRRLSTVLSKLVQKELIVEIVADP